MNFKLLAILSLLFFTSCAQEDSTNKVNSWKDVVVAKPEPPITLSVYLTEHRGLQEKVDSVFSTLDEGSIVAQLLMPAAGRLGKSEERIKYLIENKYIGGMILLNGTKGQFKNWVSEYETLNKSVGNLPFLYSADAEPSLVNRKIIGSTPVLRADKISTIAQATEEAEKISNDLNDIGINYNFSPVVDLSPNKTVGYRGFGADPKNIIPFSKAFIQQTQAQNIIATAKHFPGHGLVTGDTHKSLQVINGELKEVEYYPALINDGVLSIMVGHLAVENNPKFNTNGAPATTSKVLIEGLLRDSLGFKGLIVTDAMGMGGVVNVPNSSIKAIAAGCDILLMPKDAKKTHEELLAKYRSDKKFKARVDTSAKRIIRMKICLGLLN
ncbi:MAG: beta-N-acetylhexosaminidase [Crocinitomicaceae bacterium]|jgi:beta-N-acetylhexosaminidase